MVPSPQQQPVVASNSFNQKLPGSRCSTQRNRLGWSQAGSAAVSTSGVALQLARPPKGIFFGSDPFGTSPTTTPLKSPPPHWKTPQAVARNRPAWGRCEAGGFGKPHGVRWQRGLGGGRGGGVQVKVRPKEGPRLIRVETALAASPSWSMRPHPSSARHRGQMAKPSV